MTVDFSLRHSCEAAADPRVYETAHELLSRSDWLRGVLYVDATGKPDERDVHADAAGFCIMGALETAARTLGYTDADWSRMVSPTTRMMQLPRSANVWNNNVAASKEDVLAALEQGRYYAELESL